MVSRSKRGWVALWSSVLAVLNSHSGKLNKLANKVVRQLSGLGKLPGRAATELPEVAERNVDVCVIGGGIAGDFPICVVPMMYQDLEMHEIPFWSYFCQISDSTTSYGSYSGAHPNEKITWGKLDIHTPKYIIESDATIVAPLVFAYVLGL